MKYPISHFIVWMALIAVLLPGCTEQEPDIALIRKGVEVTVNLSLSPDAQNPFAHPVTRGGDEKDLAKVTDVWVLQFDGSGDHPGDEAILLTPPRYYANPKEEVRLLSGAKQRIIVVANTHQRFLNFTLTPGQDTYGSLKAMASDAGFAPVAAFAFDEDPDDLPMEGNVEIDIQSSGTQEIAIPMTYSVAKIEVTVQNAASSGLTITGVQLCGVPTSIDLLGGEAAYSEEISPSVYPAATYLTTWTNFPQKPLTLQPGGADYQQTWYVPRNQRGEAGATTADQKTKYAQYMGTQIITTCVEVTAMTADGSSRTYRFLAGADPVVDMNIRSGYHYTAKLQFKSPGTVGVDMRIVDYRRTLSETIDYVKDASGAELSASNCYILNPPLTGKRVYLIPINRADDYWTTTDKGYQKDNSQFRYRLNSTASGNGFGTELIWQDEPGLVEPRHIVDGVLTNVGCDQWPEDNQTICITRACGPFSSTDRLQNYIEITVPAGVEKRGNFLLGIYSADVNFLRQTDGFSWSLHFWVTDYVPGDSVTGGLVTNFTPGEPGQYIVPAGHVHRYAGAYWASTAEYGSKVMMDRNIGTRSTAYPQSASGNTAITATDPIGALFYQYGRKDPFPAIKPFDETNEPVTIRTAGKLGTLNEAVQYPTTIYGSATDGYWACDAPGSTTAYENGALYWWQDSKAAYKSSASAPKTFFDPSPYGWKIPRSEAWADFTVATTTNAGAQSRFTPFNTAYGGFYWPVGAVYGSVFYPAVGYINETNVLTGTSGVYTYSVSPYSNMGYAVSRLMSSGNAALNNVSRRSALSARSIQE